MADIDEQILRATKEIVVKFIEAGRISPNGFHESFQDIYQTVEKTTKDAIKNSQADKVSGQEPEEILEKKIKRKNK